MRKQRRMWLIMLLAAPLLAAAAPGELRAQGAESQEGQTEDARAKESKGEAPDEKAEEGEEPKDETGGETGKTASSEGGGEAETAKKPAQKLGPEVAGKRWPRDSEIYDPAWARYRVAFVTLANGDKVGALEQLEQLREKYEGHPAALFARPVIDRLQESIARDQEEQTKSDDAQGEADDESEQDAMQDPQAEAPPGKTDRLGVQGPTNLARAELATFQTFNGIALGTELCVIANCIGPGPALGSVLLGGGGGLAVSLYGTRNGITPGQALSLNSGVMWGFWQGIAINFITENWVSGPRTAFLPLFFGQVAGMGAGYGLYRAFQPTGGDVATVNWAGAWSGAYALMSIGLLQGPAPPLPVTFGTLMAASNLGGLGGALLASVEPMSRGRVWVINASGAFGALLGIGTAAILSGGRAAPSLLSGSAMLGSAGGLGLAGFMTRDWSLVDSQSNSGPQASVQLMPAPEGRGAMLSLAGSF